MRKTADNRKPISETGKQRRLRWDDARVFLAIARSGSLSGAALQLGLGLATVSRQIERLEATLGLTLFSRHQTGYRLTDDGAALLARAEALEQAAAAFADGSGATADVSGRVRLATTETLANYLIIPALPGLFHRYPELTLDITTDVQSVNLHRRDADLAVRLLRPERGNVTVKRIGTLGFGLYASSDYLARQNRGQSAEDRYITWGDSYSHLPAADWLERKLAGRAPQLTTTTLSAQLLAARAGLGLALLPHFLGRQHGLICHEAEKCPEQDIWLVVHADLAQSRRVDVVSRFLTELFRAQHFGPEGA